MSHVVLRQGLVSRGGLTYSDYAGYAVDIDVPALGLADNDPIVTMSDKSGNARHGTQADSAKRAVFKTNVLNGKAGALLDGVNDGYTLGNLSAVFATAGTLYCVATVNDTNYSIFDTHANSTLWRYSANGDGYLGVWKTTRISNYPVSPFMPTTGAHVFSIRSSASAYEIHKTGVSGGVQAGGHSAGGEYKISSATVEFGGHLHRLILYSAYHSDGDRLAVENLLRAEYAL